eukprot:Em0015g917a
MDAVHIPKTSSPVQDDFTPTSYLNASVQSLRDLPLDNRPSSTSADSAADMLSQSISRRFPYPLERSFSNQVRSVTPATSDIGGLASASVVDMTIPTGISTRYQMYVNSREESRRSRTEHKQIGIQTEFVEGQLNTTFEHSSEETDGNTEAEPWRGLRPSSTRSPLPDIGREKLLTYDIGETVAEGNYALVKQCRSLATGEQLLLKMIKRAHTFGYEDIVCNEAVVMRNLCHKNILHLLDDWETDDYIWMLMPSFNKELELPHITILKLLPPPLHSKEVTFTSYCWTVQYLLEPDVAEITRQLLCALIYLHSQLIVHRDIKVENIFLAALQGSYCLKLSNFTLATVVTEPLSRQCGLVYYRAPEMISGTGYGTKVDVWAVGVVCYLLLSGTLPFQRKSEDSTCKVIRTGHYTFTRPRIWKSISNNAKHFISHLLVLTPQNRPSSSEILQHPWLKHTELEGQERIPEQSKVLMACLESKRPMPKLFVGTSLDRWKEYMRSIKENLPLHDQQNTPHHQGMTHSGV